MNRDDFQLLSKMRVAEAKTLLDAGQYTGSRYLMGYAVECVTTATTEVVARDYYKACVTAKTGVLTWIKKQW